MACMQTPTNMAYHIITELAMAEATSMISYVSHMVCIKIFWNMQEESSISLEVCE